MGLVATAILGVACLIAGSYLAKELRSLTESGLRTQALVADIERGARNSRWPVYEFSTISGVDVRARDINQLMFAPIDAGDTVTVIYDPADPSRVTADLGLWVWRGPLIFFSGAALLAALGAAIWRHARQTENAEA